MNEMLIINDVGKAGIRSERGNIKKKDNPYAQEIFSVSLLLRIKYCNRNFYESKDSYDKVL